MREVIPAHNARIVAQQASAAAAAAQALAEQRQREAQAIAEQQRQEALAAREAKERREAEIKVNSCIDDYLRSIKLAAQLGQTEIFFAAVQEDTDYYWEYFAQSLRELGYEVDITFIEERRRFNARQNFVNGRPNYPANTVEIIDYDPTVFRGHGNYGDAVDCCCNYKFLTNVRDYNSKVLTGTAPWVIHRFNARRGISVYRFLWVLEVLWMLTLIGPLLFGAWFLCGFAACVSDPARTKMTCNAPNLCNYWGDIHVQPNAIWYVTVSWANPAPVSAATATTIATAVSGTATGTAAGTGGAAPKAYQPLVPLTKLEAVAALDSIPIAIPIDSS